MARTLPVVVLFYVFFALLYVFLCSMYCLFFWRSLYCLCICVLNNCHRVPTQLQLNISYHYAMRVEKNNQHGLDARPLALQFLRPRGCVDKSGSGCLKIPVNLTNPKDVHNGSPLYITHKKIYIITLLHIRGLPVAQLVEALRYKPESRGFDSRRCH